MPDAMVEKFGGKKRPPKFADEGPPSDSDNSRGGGSGPSGDSYGADSAMPDDGDMGGGDPTSAGGPPDTADPEEKSVDDMSDILGVGPEDRQDFAAALKAYVSACVASIMAPPPDMGAMPDVGGSEPDSDDEEGPSPEEG